MLIASQQTNTEYPIVWTEDTHEYSQMQLRPTNVNKLCIFTAFKTGTRQKTCCNPPKNNVTSSDDKNKI